MGGGNFVVPVQTVTDFLENKLSGKVIDHLPLFTLWLSSLRLTLAWLYVPVTSVPPSSYRLGVKAANLHQLFPAHITEALKHSLVTFDKEVCIFHVLKFSIPQSINFSIKIGPNIFFQLQLPNFSVTRIYLQWGAPSWCRGNKKICSTVQFDLM